MENIHDPLRQMILFGQARQDFFTWYYTTWAKHPDDPDVWTLAHQLRYYSDFFGENIEDANDFYRLQDLYNSRQMTASDEGD